MPLPLTFTLSIHPVPKGRPRLGKGRVYTPKKTRSFEHSFRILAMRYAPRTPLPGPLHLRCNFLLSKPKSTKATFPTTRPDLDNFLKAVMDAGNDLLWEDDSQIISIKVDKGYTNGPGYIEIEIKELANC